MMLIRIVTFITCILYSYQASANIFESMSRCIKDPCNCGFDDKKEWYTDSQCDDSCFFTKSGGSYTAKGKSCDASKCRMKYKSRNPNNLCPPYNKDGGRKNFTCLTRPDLSYPIPFVPLFFEKCIEQTQDSTYKKPQLKLRAQTCNNTFCWTTNNTLSWDGECVTLAGGYGFPLHRICARIALPRQAGSGTKGEPNYIPEKPADPGYTDGKHIDNFGREVSDPLTRLSDGTQVRFIHPKLCAYYDPAFIGISPPNIDFFDLDPNKQPLHAHTDEKSVIIKIIDFFVDAAEGISDSAVSLIKQLIKAMSGGDDSEDGSDEQDGTTFWSILSDVFKYIGWLIDKILDLLKQILDEIGGLNRVVEDNLGCVELPIGPYPPPFWPIIVDLFDNPRTERVCHQNMVNNKMVLKELSLDVDPCVVSGYENNAIHNVIRASYNKFIPLCKDTTSTNPEDNPTCVTINGIEQINSFMKYYYNLWANQDTEDTLDKINNPSHNATLAELLFRTIPYCNDGQNSTDICVNVDNICAKTTDINNCREQLKKMRLVYNVKTGPILNLRSPYVFDIDVCNPNDPNQVTCQEVWGVNIGNFIDIPVEFQTAIKDDDEKLVPPVCSSDQNFYTLSNQTALSKKFITDNNSDTDKINASDSTANRLRKIQAQVKNYSLVASIVREVSRDKDYEDDDDADDDKNNEKRGECFKYTFSGQSPENICIANNSSKELVGCQKRVPPAYINLGSSENSDYFQPKAVAMLSAEEFNMYLTPSEQRLTNEKRNKVILDKVKATPNAFPKLYHVEVTLPYYNGDSGNYEDYSDSSDDEYNKLMNQQNILGYDVTPKVTDESFAFPPYNFSTNNVILGTKFGNYVYKDFESCFKAGDAITVDRCKYYTADSYSYDYMMYLQQKGEINNAKFVPLADHKKDVDKDGKCKSDKPNKYDKNYDDRVKKFQGSYKKNYENKKDKNNKVRYCVKAFQDDFMKEYLNYVGGLETFNYVPDNVDDEHKIVKDVYIRGGTKICLDTRNTDIGRCPDDPRNCVLAYLENFDIIDCSRMVSNMSSVDKYNAGVELCPVQGVDITFVAPPVSDPDKYRPINFAPITADLVKDQIYRKMIYYGKIDHDSLNDISDNDFNMEQQKKFKYLKFVQYHYTDNNKKNKGKDNKKTCFTVSNNAPQDFKERIESGLCKISVSKKKRIIPKPSEDLTQYENHPGKTYFPVDISAPPPGYAAAVNNVTQDEGGKFAKSLGNSLIIPIGQRVHCTKYLENKECLDDKNYYQCDPNKCLDFNTCQQISLEEIKYHKSTLQGSCLNDGKYDCTSATCVQSNQAEICNKIQKQSEYINQFQNKNSDTNISVKFVPTTDDYADDLQYANIDKELEKSDCIKDKKYVCDSSECDDKNKCTFVKELKIQRHNQEKSDDKKACLNDISSYQTATTYADNTDKASGLYDKIYNPLVNGIRNKTPQEVRKCVSLKQKRCDTSNDDYDLKWDKDHNGQIIQDKSTEAGVDVNQPIFARCHNQNLVPRLCILDTDMDSSDDPKLFDFDMSSDDFKTQYCSTSNTLRRYGKVYDSSSNITWSLDDNSPGEAIGTCGAEHHIEPRYDEMVEYFVRSGISKYDAPSKKDGLKIKYFVKNDITTNDILNSLISRINELYGKNNKNPLEQKRRICNKKLLSCSLWIITDTKNYNNADSNVYYGFGLLSYQQWARVFQYYRSLNNKSHGKVTTIKALFAPAFIDDEFQHDNYNLIPYWPNAKCVPDAP